jgi:hypothetical protein
MRFSGHLYDGLPGQREACAVLQDFTCAAEEFEYFIVHPMGYNHARLHTFSHLLLEPFSESGPEGVDKADQQKDYKKNGRDFPVLHEAK